MRAARKPEEAGLDPGPEDPRGALGERSASGADANDDLELMRRIQADDQEAFRLFVERHQKRLFRAAVTVLRQREEALDAVQETFVKIWRARSGWRPGGAPGTWTWRILMNECLDRQRRLRIRRAASLEAAREAGVPDPVDASALPDDRAIGAQRRRRLYAAIDALPARQRSVLLLRHAEGLSLDEIATALGCSLGTVKSSLHRGLRRLEALK